MATWQEKLQYTVAPFARPLEAHEEEESSDEDSMSVSDSNGDPPLRDPTKQFKERYSSLVQYDSSIQHHTVIANFVTAAQGMDHVFKVCFEVTLGSTRPNKLHRRKTPRAKPVLVSRNSIVHFWSRLARILPDLQGTWYCTAINITSI